MKTLKFSGWGNNVFAECGITNQSVENCIEGKPVQCMIDCGTSGRLIVVGQYSSITMGSGCWLIGISKFSRWEGLPDWNFRYEDSECDFSTTLLMDLPDVDFELIWFVDGKEMGRWN